MVRFALFLLVILFSLPSRAVAATPSAPRFELTMSNDILVGNLDDRYTAAIGGRLPLVERHLRVELSERMFTDRAAGQRFDETRLALVREGLEARGWVIDLSAGVLHVGRGLFGESAQNAIHRLWSSAEVDLDYLDDQRFHFELGGRAIGPERGGSRWGWHPEAEVAVAPAFSRSAAMRVAARGQVTDWLELRVSAGARHAHSRNALLAPHLESLAPELGVGITLFDRLSLAWTDNAYGTGDDHVHLVWRLRSPDSGGRGSR